MYPSKSGWCVMGYSQCKCINCRESSFFTWKGGLLFVIASRSFFYGPPLTYGKKFWPPFKEIILSSSDTGHFKENHLQVVSNWLTRTWQSRESPSSNGSFSLFVLGHYWGSARLFITIENKPVSLPQAVVLNHHKPMVLYLPVFLV